MLCGCSCLSACTGGAADPGVSVTASYPPLSAFSTGLRCRCPRCGVGKLFDGYLTIAATCGHCGLDLAASDSGDGPAIFVIFIVGPIVTGLALWTEVRFTPPIWVHMVLWLPMVLGGSIWLLRPFKAVLVALQYKHQAGDSRFTESK
ncbi:MAG: DUF983 domain-containing protein [Rhodospirillaceae bacterium]|nr:DUF983 domain-containing protein [Rhodospirillaceae bacterium]MBT5665690.1 DUF983 domain-containing protein [Rhodospirillaceae bacterium]